MNAPVPPPLIELRARLARYPADRYPIQHATASFHLGFALTEAGRFIDAERALAVAAELFDPDRMPAEHAKALNARGAALRAAGLPDAAAGCFQRASAAFAALGQPLEHGAALFNLGLARRDLGEDPIEDFRRAQEQLDPDRVPAHASAAARELGAALLTAGRSAEAAPVLAEAIALADRGGDLAGLGAAANTLGLVHLALGATAEAIEVLHSAVGAHPRTVRPDGHAMAKANLALAHERAGDTVRARLAARQALGFPGYLNRSAPRPRPFWGEWATRPGRCLMSSTSNRLSNGQRSCGRSSCAGPTPGPRTARSRRRPSSWACWIDQPPLRS
ncbi:tetratricopeptide repeat protein [Pseudonocardia kunmingensis]|uniref:Uncharacterized protein n=1 Tax=Pseudonocardia kunmingensis TaxID=630975 RepID=A0A543DP34_9PSEU|nr:tetratricopeptide repeat protein [Pseudonocardia kunmingensis]TQM11096.1 hypothetical protein FB558_3640 [Pseudonocardia kunmingensis]